MSSQVKTTEHLLPVLLFASLLLLMGWMAPQFNHNGFNLFDGQTANPLEDPMEASTVLPALGQANNPDISNNSTSLAEEVIFSRAER